MQQVINKDGYPEYRLDLDEIPKAEVILDVMIKAQLGHLSRVARTLQGYMKHKRDWMPKQASDVVLWADSFVPGLLTLPAEHFKARLTDVEILARLSEL